MSAIIRALHTRNRETLSNITLGEAIAAVLLLASSCILAVKVLNATLHSVNPYWPSPANGSFQLLNPLRRLASGAALGNDYIVFHGAGWILPSLPGYLSGGSTFYSAEVAKQFVSGLAFPVTAAMLVWATTRSFRRWILVTGPLLAVIIAVFPALIEPGNASPGVRASAGCLAAMSVVLWHTRIDGRRWARATLATAAAAMAILLATDQALTVALAITGTAIVLPAIRRSWPEARRGLLFAAAVLATTFIAVLFLARGSLSSVLTVVRYYASVVPAEQAWFFGSPPNLYVYSWANLFQQHSQFLVVGTIGVVGLVASGVLSYRVFPKGQLPAGAPRTGSAFLASSTLFLGSLFVTASYLGYSSPHYLAIATAMQVVGGALLLSTRIQGGAPSKASLRPAAAAFVALGLLLLVPGIIARSATTSLHPDYVKGLAKAQAFVAACKSGERTWSTYSGLLEAAGNCFNPSTDYIIQAQGFIRQRYETAFLKSKPAFVQTMRGDTFNYESWLRENYGGFYGSLLGSYTPVATTGYSIIWRRNSAGTKPGLTYCGETVSPMANPMAVPVVNPRPQCRVGILTIKYSISGWGLRIPFLNRLARPIVHFIRSDANVPVTLNPAFTSATFPIRVPKRGGPSSIVPVPYGLTPGLQIHVVGVSTKWYSVSNKGLWPSAIGRWWGPFV